MVYFKRAYKAPRFVAILPLGWLVLLPSPLTAQNAIPEMQAAVPQDVAPRLRVGLVLSGGGARGAAHVGVLKVLEQLHIPIDAIAGTSMGAVVGGLYAAGMSVTAMEQLVTSVDWQAAFRDRPARATLGFRRKQDDRNFLVRYSLGVSRGAIKFSNGLVQGQQFTQILRAASTQAADITDFDQLPIPFRAVATDLATGAEVVLRSGDLVAAMRASMSAPGVFTPVAVAGRLLVDGGLTNNLPVDIARQMNVDVLIVVDVSFPLYPPKELNSPLKVTNQAFALMIRKHTLTQRTRLSADDIIIDPSLGTASSADFTQVPQALRAGEQAAWALQDRLASLAVSATDYQAYQQHRQPPPAAAPVVNFIHAAPDAQRYALMIDAAFADMVGKPLDRRQVNAALGSLYALDLFETAGATWVAQNEQTGLEVQVKRKSTGPNYFRFGISLEDDFVGNSRYNAAARLIMTELNPLGGEWLTDVQIGNQPKFSTEFYQPLSLRQQYFIAPHFEYGSRSIQLYDDDQRIAEYRLRRVEGGLDIGRVFSNWGELRAGAQVGSGSAKLVIGDSTLVPGKYYTGGYFARFSYDTLDSIFFPRRGDQFGLQWNAEQAEFGAADNSNRVAVNWLSARTLGRYTLMLSTDLGSTLDNRATPHDYFSLGGFFNLSGLTADSLTGPHFGIARMIFFRQIGRGGTGVLDMPAFAGISVEAGNTWMQRSEASFSDVHYDASLFFGADTPLGPLYLATGFDDGGKTAFYLFLGRTF